MRTGGRHKPGVRPTAARVRDALFNSLAVRVVGARVLDLFAGRGSLGLEALRRGADFTVFIEHDANLAETIRRQVLQAGWSERAEVWKKDALSALRELGRRGRQFDIVLLDPPYAGGWIPRTLEAIVRAGVLAPRGVVVAEGHWRDAPREAALIRRREARYGETALWYFERDEEGQP